MTLAGLLGLLGWFKYYTFLAVNVDNLTHHLFGGSPLPLKEVLLPVGISFFTFMAISYVIDVYRGQLAVARPVDLAVYLSFFPHLVAGPIVRGEELLPQIRHKRDPRNIDVSRAVWLIAAGLFKKMVVSSYISSAIVDPVFGSPHTHSNIEILFAIYGYAIQIYADFSGYTDIAIGIALLLGFRFPQNFDGPYTATSLQDFWRRWHMTLSRWLRDYLYIPLGGNKGSESRIARNIMITMILGGLWHGAGWTFIAWGAYHGLGQVIGRWRRKRSVALGVDAVPMSRGRVLLARIATFHLVCLGWVFFRATSMSLAFTMIGRLFTAWGSAPMVTWSGRLHDRGQHRQPVRVARIRRRRPEGLLAPNRRGPGRHTGSGAARYHHARARRHSTVHLLPILKNRHLEASCPFAIRVAPSPLAEATACGDPKRNG